MKEDEKEAGSGQGELEDRPEDHLTEADIPPASFYSVVAAFQIPAMQLLGELKGSDSEGSPVNPSLAKYYIDCLSVLDEKMRGNLQEEEKKFLDHILAELRLSYVRIAPGKTTGEQ